MKVVINKCYGGFNLSNEAVERCLELGMKLTDYLSGGYADPSADFVRLKDSLIRDQKYAVCHSRSENSFRCNPIVVRVVEELGEKANGPFAKLKIVDVPFDSPRGWEIDEYDGMERIVETHASWG